MADAVYDKNFRDEAERPASRSNSPPAETEQIFVDFYKTPPAVVAKAREIMGRQ